VNSVDGPAPAGDGTVDLQQAAHDLDLAARSLVNVMLTASDGANRMAWARAIHDRSVHRDGPFVAVCGVIVPARNRAVRGEEVDNWFERASGGTLFIDRIGDLGAQDQRRLLSLLADQSRDQTATTTSRRNRHVRIIVGNDRSLREDLALEAMSETLFYRLNVIHIDLAPLNRAGLEPHATTRGI
jgi:DNA-binding NtrC family response regulator